MRRPVEFEGWEGRHPGYGPYAAVVRHVVDGDTIDCLIDVGFNDYVYRTIRLYGIDAPEVNRAATKEAGLAAKEFLKELLPEGKQVVLYTQKDPDSFGRYLADVVFEYENEYLRGVADSMIAAGHAVWREYS